MRWLVACVALCETVVVAAALQPQPLRPPGIVSPASLLPPLPQMDAPESLLQSHGFSSSAKWLIPGRVLVGINPTKGRGSSKARVEPVCGAGCGTFVSLQQETEEHDAGYVEDVTNSVFDAGPVFVRFLVR